jgi:hypothetical protein
MFQILKSTTRAVLADRKGISSLEYIVLAVFVLGGLGAAIGLLTPQLSTFFGTTIPGLL